MSLREIFSVTGIGLGASLLLVYFARKSLNVSDGPNASVIKTAALGIRG